MSDTLSQGEQLAQARAECDRLLDSVLAQAARIAELERRRTELQHTNNAYLMRARNAEAAANELRDQRADLLHQSLTVANYFDTLETRVKEWEIWHANMKGFNYLGLWLDVIITVIGFAVIAGVIPPVFWK